MSLYHAELSAGSLMPSESQKLAALMLTQPDAAAWQQAIKVDNLLQKNTPASATRQANLIRNRLNMLDPEGWQLITDASAELRIQMLLLAAIRHSRLLGDFLLDVYRSRQRRLEKTLNPADWEAFLHECAHRDASVSAWSTSTRRKLCQVILRILAEAHYIDTTRSLRLTPPLLHPRVLRYLAEHQDRYTREAMELSR